jgi:hypothetical protein
MAFLGLALLALALFPGCLGNSQQGGASASDSAGQGANALGISDSDLGVDNLSTENDSDFTDVSVD